ncbi:hypothetical protein INS49_013437 [Diaporthe citri]|uniref:uncharacterized protein n=1 Tax=Diaporthe citri TaxID=83186 RepID=UPI001C813FBF|nr:uncharacterized protein INS49_013437 [Diaporthe citri]KAG6357560.1 hypothetical protein INS49_013437 [Diaporthe citri]
MIPTFDMRLLLALLTFIFFAEAGFIQVYSPSGPKVRLKVLFLVVEQQQQQQHVQLQFDYRPANHKQQFIQLQFEYFRKDYKQQPFQIQFDYRPANHKQQFIQLRLEYGPNKCHLSIDIFRGT